MPIYVSDIRPSQPTSFSTVLTILLVVDSTIQMYLFVELLSTTCPSRQGTDPPGQRTFGGFLRVLGCRKVDVALRSLADLSLHHFLCLGSSIQVRHMAHMMHAIFLANLTLQPRREVA